MKKNFVLLSVILFGIINISAQTPDSTVYKFKPFATIGFDAMLHSGRWGGTVPAIPQESATSIAGTKYNGPAFGININYHFLENLSFYFDINMYKRKTPVAYINGYAESMWIFEQTDYNSRLVGPFTENVFYEVNTTGFRLGLKAYLQHKKQIQPWYGAYWGYYQVTHGVFNDKSTDNYGVASNYVSGLTYLNLGIDFWDKSRTIELSIFMELGAPVVRNYSIENCLVKGWTFSDSGEGEHIFGYNRIGISLMSNTKKK